MPTSLITLTALESLLSTGCLCQVIYGKITLCDLAGSERPKKSEVSRAPVLEKSPRILYLIKYHEIAVIRMVPSRKPRNQLHDDGFASEVGMP